MEASAVHQHDIVIVGAGIAGLATSLGLHRLGIRSLVLESSDSLRITGFALGTWTNAWKALDALGIGDELRQEHERINGVVIASMSTGRQTASTPSDAKGMLGSHEIRCVKRKSMLEALARELPRGTIRFSSKVAAIQDDGIIKVVHLVDGTVLRSKVLIGCDGVNSMVAKWLGLKKAATTCRYAIRGIAKYNNYHGFESNLMQFVGQGVRGGAVPCDDKTVYWFFTWTPTKSEGNFLIHKNHDIVYTLLCVQSPFFPLTHDVCFFITEELIHNPEKLKQFVLSKMENSPNEIRDMIEKSKVDGFTASPLRYRHPWELLWANISKGNVCVAGDAFHPMTPDLGQGGCCALEDGVTLARCLGEAFSDVKQHEDMSLIEYRRIEMALKKYADQRIWRGISLICTAYMVGYLQQSDNKFMTFLRDKFLSAFLASLLLKSANFDCGTLENP